MDKKNLKNKILNKDSSVFFATFAPYADNKRLPTNGMVEPLMSFLLPKVGKLLIIIQPHPGSDRINPIVELYEENKLKKKKTISPILYFPISLICKLQNTSKTHISFKLRDFFSVIYTGLTKKGKYDFFIGLESINTAAGIVLRKFGKVEKVAYYVSDYSPERFSNSLFNSIYILLDRFCAMHADYIWDVSDAMQSARIKAGLNPHKSAPNIHVPNGLFQSQIKCLPVSKRIPESLVYMGTLGYENGPDLAIEALTKIRDKFPNAKLHIVGGGKENLNRLKNLAEKLRLGNSVIFYGFVDDNNKMAEIVRKCSVAVAPYRTIEKSVRWYADATKIRQYLGSGLPVVTTCVPPLGRSVASRNAALIAKDKKEDYADAIVSLLSDKDLYTKMSISAINLAKENTWENTYAQAFLSMERYSE